MHNSAIELEESGRTSKELESAVQTKNEPANGGIIAWVQVLAAFCLYLNTWGIANMFGVFQTYYQTTLLVSESPSNISWIGSIQVFLLFLGGTLAGPAFDMGYLRSLLVAGSVLVCFGMLMTSLCSSYWQFLLAQGITVGLGFGCLFLPTITVISEYFTTQKALAFGIASFGGSLGGVIFPLIFRQLEPRVGFGWATRSIAFIMLGTQMIPLLFMRQRESSIAEKRQFWDWAAYKSKPLAVYVTGTFFGFMGVYIAFFYIQLYALERTNTDSDLASYLLCIVNGTSILGRLVSNYYADKFGYLNMQIPNTFCAAILCFCWIDIRSQGGIIAFSALYGFFVGSFNSLPGVTVVSLSPDLSKIGVQLGMALAVTAAGSLVGEPIAGAILRSQGGWVGLQVWCGILLALAGACQITARILKVGSSFRAKA